MGMTALDRVVVGTRAGRLDPGVVLWLLSTRGMGVGEVADTPHHRGGLLGVSGERADTRELGRSGSAAAGLALKVFVRSVGAGGGGAGRRAGGVDGFVFTAGIGEPEAGLRARIGEGLAWLGVRVDAGLNAAYRPQPGPGRIGDGVWVVPTDEEWQIAALTEAVFG